MKKSLVKIMAMVWVIGTVLTMGILSIPPANLPLYLGLAVIAAVPLIWGSRGYQIFGVFAAIVSLCLALMEHTAGLRFKTRMAHFHEKLSEQKTTNVVREPNN
jgi:hypothetical protein